MCAPFFIATENQTLSQPFLSCWCIFEAVSFLFLLGNELGESVGVMKMLRVVVAALMCLVLPSSLFAADAGYKVIYDGGSLADLKTGTDMHLVINGDHITLLKDKTEVLNIPASAITEISYGQDVHRRIGAAIGLAVISLVIGALMALTKSKKHYVGLTWADGDKKGGLAIQCDKSDYRGVLAGLEGVTGKKAVDSDTMTVKN